MQTSVTFDMLNSESMQKIFGFELRKVNKQDKEDVRQNCIVEILNAMKKNPNTVPTEKFPSFCHTIIKRTVVDYYRKTNRMIDTSTTLVNYCDGADEEQGSTVEFFAYSVDDNRYDLVELQTDYYLNRDRFTNRERQVLDFMLHDPEGMSMKLAEIAQELDMNKSSATRAIQKLRNLVAY